jgi:glycosyltransferase involved in cell wall biosynthesis
VGTAWVFVCTAAIKELKGRASIMSGNSPLEVLIITDWYPSDQFPAQATFVRESAKAIATVCNVTVLVTNSRLQQHTPGKMQTSFLKPMITDKREYGLRTIRVLQPHPTNLFLRGMNLFWCIWKGFVYLSNLGYRPDALHAHVFSAGLGAMLLGKIYGIPVVVTEHFSGFMEHTLSLGRIITAKIAFSLSDRVCLVSHNLKQHIENYYGIRASFEVVRNPVDMNLFYSDDMSCNWNNDVSHILFVGRLHPIKGVPYLLKAIQQVSSRRQDFVLDIVGDGDYREEYEEMVRDLQIESFVQFHGSAPMEGVAKFMRSCHFLVSTSFVETGALVVAEVMACGKPVIATRVGCIPEMVTPENGILVDFGNVQALAEAISTMLSSYRSYNRDYIVRLAQENYALNVIAKRYERIYREIINRKVPS